MNMLKYNHPGKKVSKENKVAGVPAKPEFMDETPQKNKEK